MTEPRLSVFATKYYRGLSPSGPQPQKKALIRGLTKTLEHHYKTDAHFACYHPADPEVSTFVRVNKAGLERAEKSLGCPLVVTCAVVDVDAPKHVKDGRGGLTVDEWWEDEVTKLIGLPIDFGNYRTRNGYRLIVDLAKPLPVEEYEARLPRLLWLLRQHGIEADLAAVDWTRLFRAPYVLRGGHHERHPADFLTREVINLSGLDEPPEDSELAPKTLCVDKGRAPKGATGLVTLLKVVGLYDRPLPGHKHAVRCPWEHEHSDTWRPGNTSTVLLPFAVQGEGKHYLLDPSRHRFWCSHDHCRHRSGIGPLKRWIQQHHPGLWEEYCTPTAEDLIRAAAQSRKASPQAPNLTLREYQVELLKGISGASPTACIRSPLGSGKTQATIQMIVDNQTLEKTINVALPNRALRDEFYHRLRKALGATTVAQVERVRGREPGMCDYHFLVNPIRRPAGGEGVLAFCKECPEYQRCPFWVSQYRKKETPKGLRIRVGTHAALLDPEINKGDDPPDLTIVDESPLATLAPEYMLTTSDIEWATNHGALVLHPDDKDRLQRLIEASLNNEKLYHGVPSSALAKTIQHRPVANLEAAKRCAMSKIAATPPGKVPEMAESLPNFRALQTLADRWEDGYRGSYIRHGRIILRPKPGPPLAAGQVRYLDATSSLATANLMLGGDTQWIDLGWGTRPNSNMVVTLVHHNGGRRSVERNPKIAYATHKLFDSPTTLHITHKALVKKGETGGPQGDAPAWDWQGEVEGPGTHHNSSEVFGINKFKDCTTIVLEDWHVPLAAIASLAELIAESQPQLVEEGVIDPREAAKYELIMRPIVQAIGRLRPSPDKPIHVVWITDRIDDLPPGIVPSQVLNGWAVVYRATGILFGRAGCLEGLKHVAEETHDTTSLFDLPTAASVLGMLADSIARDSKKDEVQREILEQHPPFGDTDTADTRILNKIKDHWPDGHELAEKLQMGYLPISRVRWKKGKKIREKVDCFYHPGRPITLTQVCDFSETPDTAWLEFAGHHFAGPANEFHKAAKVLQSRGREVSDESIGRYLERSAGSVRKSLARRGITVAQLKARGAGVFEALRPREGANLLLEVAPWEPPADPPKATQDEWASECEWPDEPSERAPPPIQW